MLLGIMLPQLQNTNICLHTERALKLLMLTQHLLCGQHHRISIMLLEQEWHTIMSPFSVAIVVKPLISVSALKMEH